MLKGGFSLTGGTNSISLKAGKNLVDVNPGDFTAANVFNVTLSSGGTAPFTVNGGASVGNGIAGNIKGDSVSINSGGGIVVATGGTIVANTAYTFSNNTGLLTLLGPGTVDMTKNQSLTLSAKSGITLGDAKNKGTNNPLEGMGEAVLKDITIITGGSFKSDFDNTNTLALNNSGTGGTLIVTAGNIVNVGSNPLNAIILNANNTSGQSGTIDLTITGTQATVLGGAAVTKGTPQFELGATGLGGGGAFDVTASGTLTVNAITDNSNASLTLSGAKGLAVTDAALFNPGLTAVSF